MAKCTHCDDFNDEPKYIEMSQILIDSVGFYNYSCPINFCPNCGKELNRHIQDNLKYKPEVENIRYGDK